MDAKINTSTDNIIIDELRSGFIGPGGKHKQSGILALVRFHCHGTFKLHRMARAKTWRVGQGLDEIATFFYKELQEMFKMFFFCKMHVPLY